MRILVIDGMGGGLGRAVIENIRAVMPDAKVVALGTNALATSAMLKAGANMGATGENAIAHNCRQADYIVGAVGIVMVNAMLGEISPRIARAVSESDARKILINASKCGVHIAGMSEKPLAQYVADAVNIIRDLSGAQSAQS
ncbi:MAG: DUF3842 family protein [Oscillospiraceae bacterium]|nr:DUF3842 family protein [Oscillospiraceae bacterium]